MEEFQKEACDIGIRHRGANSIRGWKFRSLLILAIALVVPACGSDQKKFATVEAFRDTKRLETELNKGRSTKEDVKRILGEPTGTGAVFMASVQESPQEMWFYQDIELTDIKGSKGQLDLKVRQQVLLVILRDGFFDGFMWFSNDETATGWVKDSLQGKVGR
ncbi:hypothetical protein [Aromatoleum petrolei]|uniref:Lipoprotein SmpA/OmlA domain-containing protein n=1 Tax=Aromatoleum petrolei TaxID=76116 RepID=A0ABX1MUJ5_9RHOO|nr:hypothetical protein [Aromatoleum petrolei]NMF89634.1 hypothetical protein [Aromatoleum petrolei]